MSVFHYRHENRGVKQKDEVVMEGPVFLVRMYTSIWLFEERDDPKSVLQEFIQFGFIPIADFDGGVLGLHKHDGYVELGDSVAVFAEYGYNAFDEEHIWSCVWCVSRA